MREDLVLIEVFSFIFKKNHYLYECKSSSFDITASANSINFRINTWKSTGIFGSSSNTKIAIKYACGKLPRLGLVDDYYVNLSGHHFQQDETNVFNTYNNGSTDIYCVYKLDPISSSRDSTFTVQNALFGSMQITKNSDTSKYEYKGYRICFDEGGTFSISNITNGRNVLIFGVQESSLTHANNKANNIFVMGDGFVQDINDTTLYAEKIYSQNFTQPNKTFVLSLHYDNNDSYLFINGKQELKFKAKPNPILIEKRLCIGNLSAQWTTSESEKTELYGNIYDFIVEYKGIRSVKYIYDIHRYLMIKHNISIK